MPSGFLNLITPLKVCSPCPPVPTVYLPIPFSIGIAVPAAPVADESAPIKNSISPAPVFEEDATNKISAL